MVSRFLFNFLLFALLLGAMGGATLLKSDDVTSDSVGRVLMITALGAAWAGGLVALIETQIYPLRGVLRLALAALCGGLAYIGLIGGLAQVTSLQFGLSTPLLVVGSFVLGAASHAVRAQLYGDRGAEE